MKTKVKVYIARDISDELRLHIENPFQVEEGYWFSEGRSWQLDKDLYPDVSKGDKKLVWMEYKLTRY